MRHPVTVLFLLGACSGKEETEPGPQTTVTFDNEETADTSGEPEQDLTGMAGSIAIVHWGAGAYNEATYFAYGVFVDDDLGIDNLTTCLFVGGACVTEYPAVGDPPVETEYATIYTEDIQDAGDEVLAGDVTLSGNNNYGFRFYVGDVVTSLGGPGGITLDGDYAPYSGTADFVTPDELVLTAPDATAPIAVVPGQTIDLAWASPGAGGVYLEVVSFATPLAPDTIERLDDDGALTVAVDDLQFRQPFETKALLLSRIETSEVDAAGNTIQVQARSDQWIYLDFEDTTGWTELVDEASIADTCTDALLLPSIGAGQYYGDLSTFADDHDLGDYNPLTGYSSTGLDGVVPVTLLAGQTLTATYLQAYDSSIYLLDAGCDVNGALAGADSTFDGEEEVLTYVAPADGTYYLVADAWSPGYGTRFTLVVDIL
jgi:hypothetical protein